MNLTRGKKIAIGSVLGILSLLLIGLVFLGNFDWNRAKPWVSGRLSEAAGRPVTIQGNLALTWRHPAARGGWIPWPNLTAQNVVVTNPEWTTERSTAEIGSLAFSLNPISLLRKKIDIPLLQFDAPKLSLERAADGKNNWTFSHKKDSGWQVEVDQIVLNNGSIHFIDAIRHADVKLVIDTLDQPTGGYGVSWTMTGTYNKEKLAGKGRAGAVLSLRSQAEPYPLEAEIRAGTTTIAIQGTVTKPAKLAALDLKLALSGASMSQLYAQTGLVLPETASYSTQGRLIGNLGGEADTWRYEKFTGKMGGSDLSGTLDYTDGEPRPVLKGTVVSNVLQFDDLAPLIGADSDESKARRGALAKQPRGKILPVEQFKSDRWNSIDADVQFSAQKIVRAKELPINKLSTRVKLKDGVLSLNPLNFDMAGGTIRSDLKLDGNQKTIKAEMKVAARHLKLKQLFPAFKPMQASFGEINGDAKLSATGNSIAALLGHSNGEIKALINQGTISKLLLEEAGLNVADVILTKIVGDKQVKLNCMASDFVVNKGVMQTRSFVLDTEDAVLEIEGSIDLAQEQLGLTIKPRSKGLRLISFRAPIYVRGSFDHPEVTVDAAVLARKAGTALVLAAVAPVAALLPLIKAGPGESSECAALIADMKGKPVAPPAGKSMENAMAK
ncbi:AsmA family protein [soil metagenome]